MKDRYPSSSSTLIPHSSHLRFRSRTPKKPKSKRAPAEGGGTAGPSNTVAKEEGTKDHPISLLDDKVGKKRKNYIVIEENGKKKRIVDIVRLFDTINTPVLISDSATSILISSRP